MEHFHLTSHFTQQFPMKKSFQLPHLHPHPSKLVLQPSALANAQALVALAKALRQAIEEARPG